MAITTTGTLTEIVASEFIDTVIMDAAIDAAVIAQLAYTLDISNQPTMVAAMTRWILDTATDVTNEGTTDLTSETLDMAQVTATAAPIGVLRDITEIVAASTILGEAGLELFLAQDAGALLQRGMEDDLAALAGGFTNTVGSSGTDLTIANMVTALSTRRTNNARGPAAFVLDDQQTLDLTTAIAGSSAQIFSAGSNQSVLNGNSDGYLGEFLGVPVWYTNLTDTANTGANVTGMLVTTNASPGYASLGIVQKWAPRMKTQENVSLLTKEFAFTQCYGVVERYDATGVSLITDA